jgi:hypothetical protein
MVLDLFDYMYAYKNLFELRFFKLQKDIKKTCIYNYFL